MQDKGEPSTLTVFLCQPFQNVLIRKPTFGKHYVLAFDFRVFEAQLYAVGAALGHALSNKLGILEKLLFVPETNESERNRTIELCRKDAKINLEEFKRKYGREPSTFVDFVFYNKLDEVLEI